MVWSTETDLPSPIIPNHDEEPISFLTQKDTYKELIFDSSSLKPPDSPNNLISSIVSKI